MCQSSLPERTQPAPRKPSNRSAIDVPACTHACMSSPSSAATRRVIETVSGPSSAPAVVTSVPVVVPVLVLMLEGSSGAGSRAGLPDPGRDDAGRPEGATGIRRRDARVLRYAWCGDTREVRTSLADAEAREGRRLGAALLEHLADGLLGVLGERLLEQDVLLEEAVDATLERHEDTDLRRQVGARLVEVGHDLVALEARHAADLDLLADGGVGLVEQLLDGLAVLERAREERVRVGGAGLREDLVGEGDELLALGDEVGLAVDLDEGADAVGGRGRHETVGGRAALTLRDALEALDAKDLDGLGAVAVGLVERLLDVHHAGARLLAQRLDVSGGVVRHALYRSFRQWRLTRVVRLVRKTVRPSRHRPSPRRGPRWPQRPEPQQPEPQRPEPPWRQRPEPRSPRSPRSPRRRAPRWSPCRRRRRRRARAPTRPAAPRPARRHRTCRTSAGRDRRRRRRR